MKSHALLVFLAPFVVGCSSTVELASNWKAGEVLIDGKDSDWDGATSYISHSKIAVGFRNDTENLYVCIIANELSTQMQIMGGGLTLWFDTTGNQGRALGIHYPIGGQLRRRDQETEETELPEDRRRVLEEAMRDLEFLGPGSEDRLRLPVVAAKGVSVRVENSQGSLVYEIKIPLRKNSDAPFAIGTDAGKNVMIGIETRDPSSERLRGGSNERPSGRSGRGGSRGGGSPAGGAPERSEPIRFWANVHLAAPVAVEAK